MKTVKCIKDTWLPNDVIDKILLAGDDDLIPKVGKEYTVKYEVHNMNTGYKGYRLNEIDTSDYGHILIWNCDNFSIVSNNQEPDIVYIIASLNI